MMKRGNFFYEKVFCSRTKDKRRLKEERLIYIEMVLFFLYVCKRKS